MSYEFKVGDKIHSINQNETGVINTIDNDRDYPYICTNDAGEVFTSGPADELELVISVVDHLDFKVDDFQSASTDDVLKERGNRYGEFPEHARITQNIKTAMVDSPNWKTLPNDTKEALELIAHKIGRVLNGDPDYADNFTDIAGYARLVEKRLLGIYIDGRKNA